MQIFKLNSASQTKYLHSQNTITMIFFGSGTLKTVTTKMHTMTQWAMIILEIITLIFGVNLISLFIVPSDGIALNIHE